MAKSDFPYACILSDQSGGRCRGMAVEADGRKLLCKDHLKMDITKVEQAPDPTIILVRFHGDYEMMETLRKAGIEEVTRDEASIREKRIKSAEATGRKLYQYRPKGDTGVPVFGKQGIPSVWGVDDLLQEIGKDGYVMRGLYFFSRTYGQREMYVGTVLVGSFSKEKQNELSPDRFLVPFSEGVWGSIHVWANPPEDGEVFHTVNLTLSNKLQSPYRLKFNRGAWGLETVEYDS